MTEYQDQLFTSAADLPWSPKHPGHFVKADILAPHGLTQDDLAEALGVARGSINALVGGRRELTIDMARRLSEFTGQSAEYWRALQTQYDLWLSRRKTPSYGIEPLAVLLDADERAQAPQRSMAAGSTG